MLELTVADLALIREALTIAERELRNADTNDVFGPCYQRSTAMGELAKVIDAASVPVAPVTK